MNYVLYVTYETRAVALRGTLNAFLAGPENESHLAELVDAMRSAGLTVSRDSAPSSDPHPLEDIATLTLHVEDLNARVLELEKRA